MSKVTVPIGMQENLDLEAAVAYLRKIRCERVFLAQIYRALERDADYFAVLERVRQRMAFFRNAGFEVGIWLPTIGYGGPVLERNRAVSDRLTHIRSITGRVAEDALCPTDGQFVDIICAMLADHAALHPDLLMLDDELCLSVRPGIGCACERHLAEYRRRLGEDVALEELPDKLFTGGRSRYRDVWLELMGDTLRHFCRRLREAVDQVDPTIRMGFCAGFTSWDLEGADALELTKILAGNTRPFLRFTGAPYWTPGHRFQTQPLSVVIECARQQYAWCRDTGVEVFTEGDTYPHNRCHVAAAYLECFDLATRVSDDMDALKYFFGYVSPLGYETGYIDSHIQHMPLHESITAMCGDKTAVGIRVYQTMHKCRGQHFPGHFIGERAIMQRWFSSAACLLSTQAIPTVYEGRGICGIAFGDDALALDEAALSGGMILDVQAAALLAERGVDTGLLSAAPLWNEYAEKFEAFGIDTVQNGTCGVYAMEVADGVQVQSRFHGDDGSYIASYCYENAAGQRFLVYGFCGDEVRYESSTLRSYCRGRQINALLPWLCGKASPAVCEGHPFLYCLCKEKEGAMAVAYINCHPDEIYDAQVTLSRPARRIRFLNCEGTLQGNTVTIRYIKAFGFAAFEVDEE